MRFSVDYDKTYTRDPSLFDALIKSIKLAGHEVVCVTMRMPEEAIAMPCEVIYTSRRAKALYVAEKNIKIDIWIDDSPHWLVQDAPSFTGA